ncbi:porin [Shewanella khirikhana]|uniref:Gram-negative porin n=1 Tax=Shewanella khirikhana TaxID=1965282 RepID=A0ABM7CYR0_9GAMM|nr:porin [Shewanella khirikhana]AZQ09235.1 Gram-negative porin [Shewanella khirikhana]
MNKTLISASLLGLGVFSAAAFAEGPAFYGRIDLAVTNSDAGSTLQSGTNGVTVGESGTYFENNFSHLGVKGSENISSGLDIIYQLEFQVENTSSKGDTFKPRNSYLGIKTAAGTLLVGRNDTVFKQSEGGIDLFGNTNADMDRLLAGQTRSADGIWYHSPVIADLITFNATYLMEDNNGSDDAQYALSVTVGDKKLKKQNFYLAGAYNKGISNVDAYRAVAQVKLGEFKLGGLFQNSESASGGDDNNTYLLNLAYNLNGVNLKAEYGKDEAGFGKYYKSLSGTAGTDISVTNITVGADYRVAKSTLLYGHYAMYEGDHVVAGSKVDLQDDNVFSVGVRYDF